MQRLKRYKLRDINNATDRLRKELTDNFTKELQRVKNLNKKEWDNAQQQLKNFRQSKEKERNDHQQHQYV